MSVKDLYMESLSMEADADGMEKLEVERTWVVKLPDHGSLEKATSFELQEQYELRSDKEATIKASVRIRKITKGVMFTDGVPVFEEESEYVFTTKIKHGNGDREVESLVSEDQFKHFKELAPSGAMKIRFNFPIEDTEYFWEVDVYPNKGDFNDLHPYARIELESPEDYEHPEFPVEIEHALDNEIEADIKIMDQLYKEVFIIHKGVNMAPVKT